MGVSVMDHYGDKEYNKALVEKYPFLLPRNVWTGEIIEDYDYEYTWLDEMPNGWRIAFGEQMCQELLDVLKTVNYENDFRIMTIKEKFGTLRIYTNGAPSEIYDKIMDILYKYEKKSSIICITCGAAAEYISCGWISPYCAKCAGRITKRYNTHSEGDKTYSVSRFFDKIDEFYNKSTLDEYRGTFL